METNYKKIAEELFGLEEDEKVNSLMDLETELPVLEAILYELPDDIISDYKVPKEVSKFFSELLEYSKNNLLK